MSTLRTRVLQQVSSGETDSRFGSLFFFGCAVFLPLLLGWKLSVTAMSPGDLVGVLLLVLITSLLCVLIGLVLPLYARLSDQRSSG